MTSHINPSTNRGFVRDAAQIGGYFECKTKVSATGRVCGFRIHIPADADEASAMIQGYLDAGGYPQHCGVTMTWVTAFEARHGSKALRQQLFDPDRGPGEGRVEGRDADVAGAEPQS